MRQPQRRRRVQILDTMCNCMEAVAHHRPQIPVWPSKIERAYRAYTEQSQTSEPKPERHTSGAHACGLASPLQGKERSGYPAFQARTSQGSLQLVQGTEPTSTARKGRLLAWQAMVWYEACTGLGSGSPHGQQWRRRWRQIVAIAAAMCEGAALSGRALPARRPQLGGSQLARLLHVSP